MKCLFIKVYHQLNYILWQFHTLKGNNIFEQKILNRPKFIELEKQFYEKFIGNSIVQYDKSENFTYVSID